MGKKEVISEGLINKTGALIYTWENYNSLKGYFALPSYYEGSPAYELATKQDDTSIEGIYDIHTYMIDGTPFSKDGSTMEIKALPQKTGGVYNDKAEIFQITWKLIFLDNIAEASGFIPGTMQVALGSGISLKGSKQLSIGWDNAYYKRCWPQGDKISGIVCFEPNPMPGTKK